MNITTILKNYQNKKIAIATHESPDGDGLAATLALYYCLETIYQAHPTIIMDSQYPEFLDFLNYQSCNIQSFKEYIEANSESFDLLIVLDCHEENRVDTDINIFKHAQKVLIIDHHEAKTEFLKDEYIYYFDKTAVSTGVMIHRFLKEEVIKYDTFPLSDYADCIYTTILNDTDNFLNSNTDKETFETVLELMSYGLKPHEVANKFLNKKSINYYKYIGEVLSTIELFNDHKIVVYYSTIKMLEKYNLTFESYSKMMRWTKGAYDVEIQVLFQEYEICDWRVSLRSEKHNVAQIAQHFGGGGHRKASGFKINGDYEDVKKTVLDYLSVPTASRR